MKPCTIEGCGKKLVGRGYCHAHYKKWQRYGDPLGGVEHKRRWGDGTVNHAGYIAVGIGKSKKMKHVIIAEFAIGKTLPSGAVVHHVNHVRSDNRNENLVICQDRAYHQLIHYRERAFDACGNASYKKCKFCKDYDDEKNMKKTDGGKSGLSFYHSKCRSLMEKRK